MTDARGDRKIYRIVKRNRRQSLQDITSKFNGDEGTRLSKRTIRRRLYQEGYRRGKIQKTLTICKVNRQRRILRCRGKRHWRPEQWQKVIFSDETQVVIGQNNSVKFNWPAKSPDLNIIENIWRCIKIKMSRKIDTIENRSDLVNAVTQIWNGLPQTYIRSLYASIPARIRQVLIQKGYATKY